MDKSRGRVKSPPQSVTYYRIDVTNIPISETKVRKYENRNPTRSLNYQIHFHFLLIGK